MNFKRSFLASAPVSPTSLSQAVLAAEAPPPKLTVISSVIHIFTADRQPWFRLPEVTPAVPQCYERDEYWPSESLARRRALLSQTYAYRGGRRDDA